MTDTTRSATDWPGLAAALVTIGLWASAFVGIRAAGEDISPGPLAFGRLVIGAVLLGGLALEAIPSDVAEASAALRPDRDSPLVMCRDDRFGFRCIPEQS